MFLNTVLFGIILGMLVLWLIKEDHQNAVFNIQLNSTYDYIIVGAGSAGSVLANRLTEDGNVTVLLIEAGGSDITNDKIRIPLRVGELAHTTDDWDYYTVPQKHSMRGMNDQRCYWPRGRVLGGSGSLNYLVYVRGSRHDFEQWKAEGCKGWGYKDVLPYFLKMEDTHIARYRNSKYHAQGGYLKVTETKVTPMPDIMRKAAEEIGDNIVDVNGEDQIGYSYMQSNIWNGERQSTSVAYLRPVMHRPNLHISINSFVTKILIKNKNAIGVEMIKDNQKSVISVKKEVIVSGGTVNSPVLLMLSGIGPRQHLEDIGIPVIADLPVGENLQDHMKFLMRYTINQSYSVNDETISSWSTKLLYTFRGEGLYSFCGNEGHIFGQTENRDTTEPSYPDYQIMPFMVGLDKSFILDKLEINLRRDILEKLAERGSSKEFTFSVFNMHPKSKGTIRLKSRDPFDHPLINPNYLQDPHDVKVLISAIRKAQSYAATKTLQEINATLNRMDVDGICDTEVFDTDSYWECLLRYFADTVYHPVSTCRMGSMDDSTAVVDTDLRVKGITGLRVVDGSVMRGETSGNTNAPVIMVAEKASDIIRGKNTVEEFRRQVETLKL